VNPREGKHNERAQKDRVQVKYKKVSILTARNYVPMTELKAC
jgi:hypothetical protein